MTSQQVPPAVPRLLKGFRDYLPEDALPLQFLMSKIQRVFERYGFSPLETPTLEYADLLLGKYGAEGDKLMYRFVDHGNRHVALRYDHTVPLARVIAMNQQVPMPFKRYVLAPVWRADKPQRGRFREFYQCDIDIVGSDETKADAEVLAVINDLLSDLGVTQFGIQVNHRKLLEALVESVGVPAATHAGVFHAIDKFPKYGEEHFVSDTRELGLTTEQTQQLLEVINQQGNPAKMFAVLQKRMSEIPKGKAALQELQSIVAHAQALGVGERLNIDLKIVRGLDYYTGMIVETVVPEAPLFGSVFGGGRYDGLIGVFANRQIPAVGVSCGLGRLYDLLCAIDKAPRIATKTNVLCAVFDQESATVAEVLACELRQAGINTEVYLGDPTKLERQLKYADKRGIPVVIWQGPQERDKDVVAIKQLGTREQSMVARDEVVAEIQTLVGAFRLTE